MQQIFLGFLLIFPISRKFIFNKFSKKFNKKKKKNNFIDGEFEDIEETMTEKYKILGKYIKDMSSETPDVETYIL